MCFNFLFYYPRGAFVDCISVPYLDDYIDLLNKLSSYELKKNEFNINI